MNGFMKFHPFEALKQPRVSWELSSVSPSRRKSTHWYKPASTALGKADSCPFLTAAHDLDMISGTQSVESPPYFPEPLTSREPSFIVEPGTVRGMVRLRSPGSGTWRALGVGGGGWKVIPYGFWRDP